LPIPPNRLDLIAALRQAKATLECCIPSPSNGRIDQVDHVVCLDEIQQLLARCVDTTQRQTSSS
jgi:hypothetical protein